MTTTSLLADMTVATATSGIILRSEQQPDPQVLENTFVDTGVLAQLSGRNSQIVYGRRGTGKSHVLRVLAAKAQRDRNELAVYVDIRVLGSAQLMTDPGRGLALRSVSVFKDLLSLFQQRLLEHSISLDGVGLEAVSDFADSIRAVTSVVTQRETTDEWQTTRAQDHALRLRLSLTDVAVDAHHKGHSEVVGKRVGHYNETFENTVVFAEVSQQLNTAVLALGINRLLLLVDEWASVPVDLQPYVAEFLKRTVLPLPKVTVKIGSLEHQSTFATRHDDGSRIGFDVGGDVFANLDLDDYYSHDRNPTGAVTFFGELLYRHLVSELPAGHLRDAHGVTTPQELLTRLFDEGRTFADLVRAGHGVIRDFLGIYTHSFFRSMSAGSAIITTAAVQAAAIEWFEIDKLTNLDNDLYEVFRTLVNEVIGGANTPYFLLDRVNASTQAIRELYDQRLIHLVKRGVTRPDAPGTRYLLYILDFGTYIDRDGIVLDPAGATVVQALTASPGQP